jgi:excisionase family DNA binding protein
VTAQPTQPKMLRSSEVAALLQVSPKTVSRWARGGKLPHTRTMGGQRKYPEAEIRELAASLRFDPEDPRLEETHP